MATVNLDHHGVNSRVGTSPSDPTGAVKLWVANDDRIVGVVLSIAEQEALIGAIRGAREEAKAWRGEVTVSPITER